MFLLTRHYDFVNWRFTKSYTTPDIVYIPINYIRNHHYDFLNHGLKKSHTTSNIVYIPTNYIRNHHYDFVNWRFTKSYIYSLCSYQLHQKSSLRFFKLQFKKSHTTSDKVYIPINYIRNCHYDFLNQQFTKSYMTPDIVYVPINYIRNCHYDFLNHGLKNLIRLLI